MIDLYTDGSGSGQGPCGWAFVLVGQDDEPIFESSGGLSEGTSNIGELMGVLRGLLYCYSELPGQHINVYCDSAYVVNAFKDDWFSGWERRNWKNSRGRKVANKEIWVELKALADQLDIKWNKIAGHTGIKWNEYVDKLAGKARKELL